MMVGNHLELKCLDDCLRPLRPMMEAKVCVLYLILRYLNGLSWIALYITYDDGEFICYKECIGIIYWWVMLWWISIKISTGEYVRWLDISGRRLIVYQCNQCTSVFLSPCHHCWEPPLPSSSWTLPLSACSNSTSSQASSASTCSSCHGGEDSRSKFNLRSWPPHREGANLFPAAFNLLCMQAVAGSVDIGWRTRCKWLLEKGHR